MLKISSKSSCCLHKLQYTFRFLVAAYMLRILPFTKTKVYADFCLALTALATLIMLNNNQQFTQAWQVMIAPKELF